jgi:opacity protein-like surface antigen
MKKLKTCLQIFLILFLVFVIVDKESSGQAKEFFFIELSGGPSIPFGEFANSDANDPSSGYATVGGRIALRLGLNFTPNYGLVSILFGNMNGTDAEPLRKLIDQQNPGYNWSIESGNWKIGGALLGLRSRLVTKSITYNIDIYGGGFNSYSPEIIATSLPNNSIRLEDKSVFALAYLISAGLSYEIGNNISLTGNVEFLGAKQSFTDVNRISTIGGTTTTTTISYDQSYNAINIVLGLKYSFM